jgi:hypothetical protein
MLSELINYRAEQGVFFKKKQEKKERRMLHPNPNLAI